jgi:HEAT repeat protein
MAPVATPLKLEGDLLEVMRAAAEDTDADVRALAIADLHRSKDRHATMALMKAWNDPVQSVYTTAIESAARHPADVVAPPLLERLAADRSTPTREAICKTLGKLKWESATPVLMELQGGQDRAVAVAAIDALKAIGSLSPLDAALQKLDTPEPLSADERELLARSKDPRVVPKLLGALNHAYSTVVAQAVAILGEMKEGLAVEPLLAVVRRDPYEQNMRGAALLALGKIGDKRAVGPLDKLLNQQLGYPCKLEGIAALAMLDAPGARAETIAAIRNDAQGGDTRVLLPIVSRLLAGPYYQPRAWEDWEQDHEQLVATISLLDQLASAGNPSMQSAASEGLRQIEKAVGAAVLKKLHSTRHD